MRARINERFTQLHTQRTDAEAKLATLNAEQPRAADPAILDEVPYAGDILPDLPPDLKARLFAAFDLSILWNKPMAQATVTVTITDATLAALAEILDPGQDGYDDTATPDRDEPASPAAVRHLARTPMTPLSLHNSKTLHRNRLAGRLGDTGYRTGLDGPADFPGRSRGD